MLEITLQEVKKQFPDWKISKVQTGFVARHKSDKNEVFLRHTLDDLINFIKSLEVVID